MKKYILLSFLLICLIDEARTQSPPVLIIPGNGVIFEADTFQIGVDQFYATLIKLDSVKNKVQHGFGFVMGSGMKSKLDAVTGDTIWEEESWSYHIAKVLFNNAVEFHFKGVTKKNLSLERIIVQFPAVGYLANGLMMGDNYHLIFDEYSQVDSSYNCAETGPSFCYVSEGISFQMKVPNEDPVPNRENTIIAFEVFEKNKVKKKL